MKIKYQKPEVLKFNVDSFGKFMNESTVGELADTFSNDSFLKFREASEVYNMGLLEKAVDIFDDLFTTNKTLLECAEKHGLNLSNIGKVLNAVCAQIDIRFFSEFEDELIDGIRDADLANMFSDDQINIFKPTRGQLSQRNIIKEIRDAIEHRRYIVGIDGLYINNPQSVRHKIDFEAHLGWQYLVEIGQIGEISSRFSGFDKLYDESVDYNLGFDENVDKFSFKRFKKKKKNLQGENGYNFYDIGDLSKEKFSEFLNRDDVEICNLKLSKQQIEVVNQFFNTHEFNRVNLDYVLKNLEDWQPHFLMHCYMQRFFEKIDDADISYNDFISDDSPIKYFMSIDSGIYYNYSDMIDDKLYKSKIGNIKDKIYVEHSIELIPTYLKMLYIINSYVNDVNVKMGLGENMDDLTHIRHSLAHGHYSLVPGTKHVLLYDPGCGYHKRIEDIDEWYKERKNFEMKRRENLINPFDSDKKKAA